MNDLVFKIELALVSLADKYWQAQMNNDEQEMKECKDKMDRLRTMQDKIKKKRGYKNGNQ